jgi:predicted dehydrogenase
MRSMRWMTALAATSILTMTAHAVETPEPRCPMPDIRFMVLDPGHFHAALVQKEMLDGVSPQVEVYAPLGLELVEYLSGIARFNARAERPTSWTLDVHAGPGALERLLKERPGSVVVLSGRNRGKIAAIRAAVDAGLSVLADKPWIIRSEDLPLVETVLDEADRRGLCAYDMMTERFEITTVLQRELIKDEGVFGKILPGSADDPAVVMESVHYLKKTVAGAPLSRPAWFFDTAQQGEGMTDVGTHLVDLVPWLIFPERAIDYRRDIVIQSARHWPTVIPLERFKEITGADKFPASLAKSVRDGALEYLCNNRASYTVRGVAVVVSAAWDWEAPAGRGDSHFARVKGSRSSVEVRQAKDESGRPELFVVPSQAKEKPRVIAALRKKLVQLETAWPGIGLEEQGDVIRVTIPSEHRVGHEAHFAQVVTRFLRYLRDRTALPSWEKANMLAKYYVTTRAVELSREGPREAPARLAP